MRTRGTLCRRAGLAAIAFALFAARISAAQCGAEKPQSRRAISPPISRRRKRRASTPAKRRSSTATSPTPCGRRRRRIDEFYQLEPNEGAPASERTDVRVLYDENNIYFAIHAFDREPDADQGVGQGARRQFVARTISCASISIPTCRGATAMCSRSMPLGARADALLQNNTNFLRRVEHDLACAWAASSPTAGRPKSRSRSAASPTTWRTAIGASISSA